ncbi:hypothetical protein ANO11243_061540 [Dothideomycetidae sp. 11243]|nr:hypothetical protein ANO11243_061540 [fungal sp. No.11243]
MRVSHISARATCSALLAASLVSGITLNVDDHNSIKAAASTMAYKMVEFYPGNKTGGEPGLLGSPYYWWEAGAMFGGLIDYWHYTGDDSYNNITFEAILHQTGPQNNFEPPEQDLSLGNDDQCFWAMTAMRAAELNFPNPPAGKPSWLSLAQAVFNRQAARWDNATCNGGLRWQFQTLQSGYTYKNSICNGCFFNLASRLAAYTGNDTYSNWASTTYDWTYAIGLISPEYIVYDGTDVKENCSQIDQYQWSYNSGIWLHGSSVMWNITQSDAWKARALGIWNASDVFFRGTNNQVMWEAECEDTGKCDTDALSFKAYLSRFMAASIKAAPFLDPLLMPFLRTSAQAAAAQCNGGADGITCGFKWASGQYDGTYGVGQQMSAMEVTQSLLIDSVSGPFTNKTGGTSQGDPSAGTGGNKNPTDGLKPITTGDKVGAGILTFLVMAFLGGGACWAIFT